MFSPVSKLFKTDVEAMTARFAMLCIMSVCNGFGIRTEHINLLNGLKNNKTFVYIAAGIVLGTIALCNRWTYPDNSNEYESVDRNHWTIAHGNRG